MSLQVSINDRRVMRLSVRVPWSGAWCAEADFDEAVPDSSLVGRARINVGPATLLGSFDPLSTGTYLQRSSCTITAGAGGWASEVTRRDYHDDGLGIKARTVIEDLAREVGETAGTIAPGKDRLGADFVRRASPASEVLALACGGAPWWVDYDGVTQVGPRTAVEVSGAYEILDVDPRFKTVEIACEDPSAIGIGAVLRGRLNAPITVRELTIEVTPAGTRLFAWGSEGNLVGYLGRSRLIRDLQAVARAAIPELPYLHTYRYRVVKQNSGDNRWHLQAVSSARRLPDISPASVHPGVSGLVAELAQGSQVLVQFVEGDPGMPVITHFAAADDSGFIPVSLALCAGATGAYPTEHATSIEATLNVVQNLGTALAAGLVALGTPTAPTATIAALAPILATLSTNPTAQAAMMAALITAADGASLDPVTYAALLASLLGKSTNPSGTQPGLGWPNVRGA